MAQSWRDMVGGAIAFVGALLILLLHQLIAHPAAPVSREYALSGQVLANYSWGMAGLLLLVGFAVGFVVRSRAWAAGVGLVLLQATLTVYEIQRFPTSHNLLPFDIFSWLVMAAPLVVGSFAGTRLRRRRRELAVQA
jgi:hypothetical protein